MMTPTLSSILNTTRSCFAPALNSWLDRAVLTTSEQEIATYVTQMREVFQITASRSPAVRNRLDQAHAIEREIAAATELTAPYRPHQSAVESARTFFREIRRTPADREALMKDPAALSPLQLTLNLPDFDTRYLLKGLASTAYLQKPRSLGIARLWRPLEVHEVEPTEIMVMWETLQGQIHSWAPNSLGTLKEIGFCNSDGNTLIVLSLEDDFFMSKFIRQIDKGSLDFVTNRSWKHSSATLPHDIPIALALLRTGGIGIMFVDTPHSLAAGIDALNRNRRKVGVVFYSAKPLTAVQLKRLNINVFSFQGRSASANWGFSLIFRKA